ncbi:hypothetical protein MBLNU230_g5387t1 [Neophaeotheca triangularis]
MSRRGIHESPMDFEYQNGTGPMDGRSPFAQLSQNAQRHPQQQQQMSKSSTNWPSTPRRPNSGSNSASSPMNKPLPPRPAFNALYSTPRKLDQDLDDSSAGETPRSPDRGADSDAPTPENTGGALSKFDFTTLPALKPLKRGENQQTGGAEVEMKDADADAVKVKSSPRRGERKERPDGGDRRDSWLVSQLSRVKHKLYSPGRGEVPRGDEGHRVMEKRIHKKRSRHFGGRETREGHHHGAVSRRTRRRGSSVSSTGTGDYDDASDSDSHRSNNRSKPRKTSRPQTDPHPGSNIFPPASPPNEGNWLSRTFTFIASHPTVPHILSFYAQLAFNLFLLSSLAYLLYTFYTALRADIDSNSHAATAEILAEMSLCTENFRLNRCDRASGGRVPAMERVCEEWERCMSRDARAVGRARVGAKTVAEVVNGFVEGISWKAMFFTCLLVFGSFAVSNLAFGFFREKAAQHQPQQQQQFWQQPPPPTPQHPQQQFLFGAPTPQRQFSGEQQMYYGWNGGGQQQHGLEPAPSAGPGGEGGGWGITEGRGSPVKKLGWN